MLLIANTTWYVINFRARLIDALWESGWSVCVAAPPDDLSVTPYCSTAIIYRCRLTDAAQTLYTKSRPSLALRACSGRYGPIVFTWTPKPNIYTALVGALVGVEVVPNIAGLGTAFIRRGALNHVVGLLYLCSLKRCRRAFFQNGDDQWLFVDNGWAKENAAERLPGSGVDLERFSPVPLPSGDETAVFLFAGRILADEGLRELITATRLLKAEDCCLRVLIAGFVLERPPLSVLVGGWRLFQPARRG